MVVVTTCEMVGDTTFIRLNMVTRSSKIIEEINEQ
jgi:hypothetical protein